MLIRQQLAKLFLYSDYTNKWCIHPPVSCFMFCFLAFYFVSTAALYVRKCIKVWKNTYFLLFILLSRKAGTHPLFRLTSFQPEYYCLSHWYLRICGSGRAPFRPFSQKLHENDWSCYSRPSSQFRLLRNPC